MCSVGTKIISSGFIDRFDGVMQFDLGFGSVWVLKTIQVVNFVVQFGFKFVDKSFNVRVDFVHSCFVDRVCIHSCIVDRVSSHSCELPGHGQREIRNRCSLGARVVSIGVLRLVISYGTDQHDMVGVVGGVEIEQTSMRLLEEALLTITLVDTECVGVVPSATIICHMIFGYHVDERENICNAGRRFFSDMTC